MGDSFPTIHGIKIILTLFFLGSVDLSAATECLGDPKAENHLIYLHGYEDPKAPSQEERSNRSILKQLTQELGLRITLPQGPVCPQNKLCWPAGNPETTLETFLLIRRQARTCGLTQQPFTLIGFSNGGYYALKLYKIHREPLLKRIIASGSAGRWDPKVDQLNRLSAFHLLMGIHDITYADGQKTAEELRKSLPTFALATFTGGHRLDLELLRRILGSPLMLEVPNK